jgi:hypothetical protein
MALPFEVEHEQVNLWGETATDDKRPSLADRFIVPPFTVLNAREGFWQTRKRAWISVGIQSEIGRGANDLSSPSCGIASGSGNAGAMRMDCKRKETASLKGGLTFSTSFGPYDSRKGSDIEAGTSIFDPVLCELAYRWFCPQWGTILDPFAGGSVRGIVAALLCRGYVGVDLRAEQVEANEAQWAEIGKANPQAPNPHWIRGDSRNVATLCPQQVDFVFSCPPYFDLEKYSDDPKDLSASGTYDAFIEAYRAIIKAAADRLRMDRFAAFVVGDIRDKRGNYRNFVSDTIAAFRDAGMALYNEAILVTSVGSLPIRVGKQFDCSRKLGKTHQNVLVFVKGDARKATEAVGPVAEVVGN